jgi:hypothetical protein
MTPTLPPAAPDAVADAATLVAAEVALAATEVAADVGAVAAFFLLLQPAIPSPAIAATAVSRIAVLFMQSPLMLLGAGRGALQDCPVVVAHNICTVVGRM